jgi:ATP-dependent DNA helicase RecG
LVEGLVESQKNTLELMEKNPNISKKELSNKIGINTTAIDKNIAQLKKKGLLRRIGPDKGGYWLVDKTDKTQ